MQKPGRLDTLDCQLGAAQSDIPACRVLSVSSDDHIDAGD